LSFDVDSSKNRIAFSSVEAEFAALQ
jgi:hypothetical protein